MYVCMYVCMYLLGMCSPRGSLDVMGWGLGARGCFDRVQGNA